MKEFWAKFSHDKPALAMVGGLGLFIVLSVASVVSPDVAKWFPHIMVGVVALAVFVTPSGIAIYRNHASYGAIIAMNFIGALFCGIGWLWALIWSLTDPASKKANVVVTTNIDTSTGTITTSPSVEYQVGDVMDGHRFNGVDWVKTD